MHEITSNAHFTLFGTVQAGTADQCVWVVTSHIEDAPAEVIGQRGSLKAGLFLFNEATESTLGADKTDDDAYTERVESAKRERTDDTQYDG